MPGDPPLAPHAPPPVGLAASAPPAQALYAVATAFEDAIDPAAILQALLRRSAAAVGAGRAILSDPQSPAPLAEWASPAWEQGPHGGPGDAGEEITQPLFHGGRAVGTLVFTAPVDGTFSPASCRAAEALSHPAAAVVAVARRLGAAEERLRHLDQEVALRDGLVAAVDHDLRTPLTSILGALQTAARPELAPADPEVALLLASALGQAQRMRRLLADLLIASAHFAPPEPLSSSALATLIGEAAEAGMGREPGLQVEVAADLPLVSVHAAALRRALAGVLRELRRGSMAGRVIVSGAGASWRITVVPDGAGSLQVPPLSSLLVSRLGGKVEVREDASGAAAVLLVLPVAPPADD
jgi:signal transduction histidine kinase